MRRHIRSILIRSGTAGLVASLLAGAAGTAGAQVLPANPDPTCTIPQAEFNGWFQTGPGLDKPVQAANSVVLDTSNNCNFYKWSAQMFLWLTSPATGQYAGGRVLGSQVFYQVDGNNNLVAQGGFGPRNLATRATKFGADGLPVVLDTKGHLREFVTAPSRSGITALRSPGSETSAGIATVRSGNDGKAEFLDADGKAITVTPRVSADMLPQALGRLALLAQRPGLAATQTTTPRQQIADVLTAKKVLIKIGTKSGSVFVEAGTGIIVALGPGQAMTDGVLLSQQTSIVFYEILVNDVYAWYLTGRKTPNGIAPPYGPSNFGLFPTSAADLQSIVDFSQSHGGPGSFPDANALAVEVKLSWVDATTLPNGAQGYITSLALLPVYNTSNSADWAPIGTRPAIVALVGAHIVGSANNHPEMIWATFEHQANSPLSNYDYYSGGQKVSVPKSTLGAWLFSASGASDPFNKQLATFCSSAESNCTPNHIFANTSQPIGPSNIMREQPWGVDPSGPPNQQDPTAAASNTEIISLGTDLRAKLSAAGAAADPRFNYLLIGATWTLNGGQPSGRYPGGDEIGTSTLANSTMETFVQGSNCFDCHNDLAGSTPTTKADTSVSHMFSVINPLPLLTQVKQR